LQSLVKESSILQNKPLEQYDENMAKCIEWLEFIVRKKYLINIIRVSSYKEEKQDVPEVVIKAFVNGKM
jgi:hypothetical protein